MARKGWSCAFLFLAAFSAFASALCPTACVVIPEQVIIERIPQPVPAPAAETAIIKAFLSYDFHVVDQAQVKFLRMTDSNLVDRARKGDLRASDQLSERFVTGALVLDEAKTADPGLEAPRMQRLRWRIGQGSRNENE